MRIEKVINEDMVSAKDSSNRIVILTGNQIGQGAEVGQEVDLTLVDGMHFIENRSFAEQLITVMSDVPKQYVLVVHEIVEYASKRLLEELSPKLYISLMDFLAVTSMRLRHGTYVPYEKSWDLSGFYPKECELAHYAISCFKEKLQLEMSTSEEEVLASMFIRAQSSGSMEKAMEITYMIQDILKLISYYFEIDFKQDDKELQLFIKHLKAFAHRLFSDEMLPEQDKDFQDSIRNEYPRYFHCAEMIKQLIKDKFHCELTREEVVYITIHIGRMMGEE